MAHKAKEFFSSLKKDYCQHSITFLWLLWFSPPRSSDRWAHRPCVTSDTCNITKRSSPKCSWDCGWPQEKEVLGEILGVHFETKTVPLTSCILTQHASSCTDNDLCICHLGHLMSPIRNWPRTIERHRPINQCIYRGGCSRLCKTISLCSALIHRMLLLILGDKCFLKNTRASFCPHWFLHKPLSIMNTKNKNELYAKMGAFPVFPQKDISRGNNQNTFIVSPNFTNYKNFYSSRTYLFPHFIGSSLSILGFKNKRNISPLSR